jgi:hypothetical protein
VAHQPYELQTLTPEPETLQTLQVSNIAHEGLVTKATGTNEVHDKGVAVKEVSALNPKP